MTPQQCKKCREMGTWRGTGTVHTLMRDFWECPFCNRQWDTPHQATITVIAVTQPDAR